jgi:hypothetical protein
LATGQLPLILRHSALTIDRNSEQEKEALGIDHVFFFFHSHFSLPFASLLISETLQYLVSARKFSCRKIFSIDHN